MSNPRKLTDHYTGHLSRRCTGANAVTAARRERMASWTASWIERELSCQPASWDAFEEGAHRCYQYGGAEWPGLVVRVPSPLIGVVAVMAVQHALTPALLSLSPCCIDGFPKQAVGWAAFALADLVAQGAPSTDAAAAWLTLARTSSVRSVRDTVLEIDRIVSKGGLQDPISAAVAGAVQDAFVTFQQPRSMPGDAEWQRQYDYLGECGRLQIEDADAATCKLIDAATLEAVLRGVAQPVCDALSGPVETCVGDAVEWAGGALNSRTTLHHGGWGLGTYAARAFLREVCNVEFPESVCGADLAYVQAATSAGWWWAGRSFVLVSDRPEELHVRSRGVDGTGWELHGVRSMRRGLRRGPAISWRDGSELWPRPNEDRFRYPGLQPSPSWELRPEWEAYPWYEATKHLP